jgi:ubiquinone/menaquinone biosynthesis C-methylase UbiE
VRGHGFTDVDAQDRPEAWVECLDTLHRHPFYRTYKARVAELVAPRSGGLYLEVGGGTGDDAVALTRTTQATVVVLDRSETMLREARRRGIAAATEGDAAALPFPDGAFDGCWADRTLQHVADPVAAVGELVRVTRRGGRVVVVDPDYDTQVVSVADPVLARKVLRYRSDHMLRNGALSHRMASLFADAGLGAVDVETMTLVVRDITAVDNTMGLRSWAATACEDGLLSQEDVGAWERAIDQAVANGTFLYTVTFFLTYGCV